MENKKPILITIVCATISLILVSAYVSVRRGEMTKEFGEEMSVVVAARDIPEYAIIKKDDLEVQTTFRKFRQPQTVTNINEIAGKAAYIPFYKGEQVTMTKLINTDGKPVLDRQLDKKMRAVTITVSPHTGVGRLVRPGNHVDILSIPNYDKDGVNTYEVKTLVQNVLVLATGKTIQNSVPTRIDSEVLEKIETVFEKNKRKDLGTASREGLHTSRPDDNYSNITLQLSPEDAQRILFVSHSYGDGRLYFTLRNSADQQMFDRIPTTLLDEVMGPDSNYGFSKQKPPPTPPPGPPKSFDRDGGNKVNLRY